MLTCLAMPAFSQSELELWIPPPLTNAPSPEGFTESFSRPFEISLKSGEDYLLFADPRRPNRWYYCRKDLRIAIDPETGNPRLRLVQGLIDNGIDGYGQPIAGANFSVSFQLAEPQESDIHRQLVEAIFEQSDLGPFVGYMLMLQNNFTKNVRYEHPAFPANLVTTTDAAARTRQIEVQSFIDRASSIKPSSSPFDHFKKKGNPLPDFYFSGRSYYGLKLVQPVANQKFVMKLIGLQLPVEMTSWEARSKEIAHLTLRTGNALPLEFVRLPILSVEGTIESPGTGLPPFKVTSNPVTKASRDSFWLEEYSAFDAPEHRSNRFAGTARPGFRSAEEITVSAEFRNRDVSIFETVIKQQDLSAQLQATYAMPYGFRKEKSGAEDTFTSTQWDTTSSLFPGAAMYPIDPVKLVQDWIKQVLARGYAFQHEVDWLQRIRREFLRMQEVGYEYSSRELILWEKLDPLINHDRVAQEKHQREEKARLANSGTGTKFVTSPPPRHMYQHQGFFFKQVEFESKNFKTTFPTLDQLINTYWVDRALTFLFKVKSSDELLALEPPAVWEYNVWTWGGSFGMHLPRTVHVDQLRRLEPDLTLLRFLSVPSHRITPSPGGVWEHDSLVDPAFGVRNAYDLSNWDFYKNAVVALKGEPAPAQWPGYYEQNWLLQLEPEQLLAQETAAVAHLDSIEAEALAQLNDSPLTSSANLTFDLPQVTPAQLDLMRSGNAGEINPPELVLPDISSDAAGLGFHHFSTKPGLSFQFSPQADDERVLMERFLAEIKTATNDPIGNFRRTGKLLPESVSNDAVGDKQTVTIWYPGLTWEEADGWSFDGELPGLKFVPLSLGASIPPDLLTYAAKYQPRMNRYNTVTGSLNTLSYYAKFQPLSPGAMLIDLPSREVARARLSVQSWTSAFDLSLERVEGNFFHGNEKAIPFTLTRENSAQSPVWLYRRPWVMGGEQSIPRVEVIFHRTNGTSKSWSRNGRDLSNMNQNLTFRSRDWSL